MCLRRRTRWSIILERADIAAMHKVNRISRQANRSSIGSGIPTFAGYSQSDGAERISPLVSSSISRTRPSALAPTWRWGTGSRAAQIIFPAQFKASTTLKSRAATVLRIPSLREHRQEQELMQQIVCETQRRPCCAVGLAVSRAARERT